jgi:outer membrane protein assembly factor BamA
MRQRYLSFALLKQKWKYFSWMLGLLIFTGCSISSKIPAGKSYFKNHRIEIHDNNPLKPLAVSQDELLGVTKIKPNRKLIFFRLNMRINTWFVPLKPLERSLIRAEKRCERKNLRRSLKGKPATTCNSFWGWLAYTVGEPPVLLDSSKVEKSATQMQILLQKSGYFQAKVRPVYSFGIHQRWLKWDKNACNVVYHIYSGPAYQIQNIDLKIEDEGLAAYKKELLTSLSDLKGKTFNVNEIDQRRDDITLVYNNRGYFEFTKDYIQIEADSTVGKNMIDVTYSIRKQMVNVNDKEEKINHRKYIITEIEIDTDYNPLSLDTLQHDTIQYEGLNILYYKKNYLKPKLIEFTSTLQKNKIYEKRRIDQTYKRFGQLGVAKNVYIELQPSQNKLSDGSYPMKAKININQAERQTLSIVPKVTNRSGFAGVFGNLVYRHKNLLGGAENLEVKVLTGFEASQLIGNSDNNANNAENQIQNNFQLNTFEVGPQVAITLPKLFPFPYHISGKSSEPKTTIQATYNYQKRPDYERTLTQISADWSFIENPDLVSRFNIEWAEFSVIKIDKSAAFEEYIESFNDQFLANSYQNHFIAASKIGFSVNTQKSKFEKFNYYYQGILLEGAGNALRGIFNVLPNTEKDEFGSYEIRGIRFAQYVKTEHDIRIFFSADERNTIVNRAFIGVAAPLKNLESLPFEKSYFVGGSNGIRAWQARTLGLGSFQDTINQISFNNIGDIKLEYNFEYRFKITKKLQPALFVDAGNIWLMRNDPSRPNSQFDFKHFYREIAIGAGGGMRFDFDFFIVRLDMGFPLKDPQKVEGERWAWQPKTQYNQFVKKYFNDDQGYRFKGVLNFGIGFPF